MVFSSGSQASLSVKKWVESVGVTKEGHGGPEPLAILSLCRSQLLNSNRLLLYAKLRTSGPRKLILEQRLHKTHISIKEIRHFLGYLRTILRLTPFLPKSKINGKVQILKKHSHAVSGTQVVN